MSNVVADEKKAELIQLMRRSSNKLSAAAAERMITLNLSQKWWDYFLNEETRAFHEVRILADALMRWGENMGGDNIAQFDTKNDGLNPLAVEELDKLALKAHLTIDFTADAPEGYHETAMQNLDLVASPMTDTTYCNPRGKQINVTLVLDPKAKSMNSNVSQDGNTYTLIIPACIGLSTSAYEQAFKQGL